ncbi:jg21178 [Pararge aegeria aegeria]|uniref:Jg21178 protein n=1 Tax=Pararge aegeria aegeria TaxID=348720 RepID=A0A8S4SI58_9NEOP|nr:jg21178 [Pararge aegeria aegeria]
MYTVRVRVEYQSEAYSSCSDLPIFFMHPYIHKGSAPGYYVNFFYFKHTFFQKEQFKYSIYVCSDITPSFKGVWSPPIRTGSAWWTMALTPHSWRRSVHCSEPVMDDEDDEEDDDDDDEDDEDDESKGFPQSLG